MPPKRKAAAKNGGKAAKKRKAEETEIGKPATTQDKINALKAADKAVSRKYRPDSFIPDATDYEVYLDYDAMLNQTNIGQNNNKFYVIQVLKNNASTSYFSWNRWGRVGEPGQNAMKGPFASANDAVKDFEKKFTDKTKNKWANRDTFKSIPGKYTLIEMAGEDDAGEDTVDAGLSLQTDQKVSKCSLDPVTQELVKLIFDNDMFRETMQRFDIDVKKMPLGKLSKTQIAKGFEILERLEEAVKKKSTKPTLEKLSSEFFTAIPHNFGRRLPPVIDNQEMVQQKYDMLGVLGDIEIAQSMKNEKKENTNVSKTTNEVPNPLDVNYGLLKCTLTLVDKKSKDYKILEKYFKETKPTSSWRNLVLREIWQVDREGEAEHFKAHDNIKERKLLWHGTNVAVVAAILKTGLRIMPHSGGRVGRGIYFASENDKSAGYVSPAGKKGIMFLNEVAVGKQHCIYSDNPNLTTPPKGYDSVLACGTQEPDSAYDVTLTLDGKPVVVPQAKPKQTGKSSSFYQSEYLIYKESQNRIRYLLLLDF